MIGKLLFTLLVVAGLLTFARHRGMARQPAPAAARREPADGNWNRRLLPAALLGAMLAVAALVFWLQWREEHRVYTLRVTDTRSGEMRTYAVYKDQVEARRFTTIDGRVVTLADVERMELTTGEPSSPDDQ